MQLILSHVVCYSVGTSCTSVYAYTAMIPPGRTPFSYIRITPIPWPDLCTFVGIPTIEIQEIVLPCPFEAPHDDFT